MDRGEARLLAWVDLGEVDVRWVGDEWEWIRDGKPLHYRQEDLLDVWLRYNAFEWIIRYDANGWPYRGMRLTTEVRQVVREKLAWLADLDRQRGFDDPSIARLAEAFA